MYRSHQTLQSDRENVLYSVQTGKLSVQLVHCSVLVAIPQGRREFNQNTCTCVCVCVFGSSIHGLP